MSYFPLIFDAYSKGTILSPDMLMGSVCPRQGKNPVNLNNHQMSMSIPASTRWGLRVNNRHVHLLILAHTEHSNCDQGPLYINQ